MSNKTKELCPESKISLKREFSAESIIENKEELASYQEWIELKYKTVSELNKICDRDFSSFEEFCNHAYSLENQSPNEEINEEEDEIGRTEGRRKRRWGRERGLGGRRGRELRGRRELGGRRGRGRRELRGR